jgi:hypothetical protein
MNKYTIDIANTITKEIEQIGGLVSDTEVGHAMILNRSNYCISMRAESFIKMWMEHASKAQNSFIEELSTRQKTLQSMLELLHDKNCNEIAVSLGYKTIKNVNDDEDKNET